MPCALTPVLLTSAQPATIAQMPFPARPRRLEGFPYHEPGPVYHCRLGCNKRTPYLATPPVADLVVDALHFRHGRSAQVLAYCVMPDHLHLLLALLKEGVALSRWVADLKRWTVREAKEEAHAQLVWQANFYEHIVRKDEELATVARYILENPVRKGLAARWQEYGWCGSMAWRMED
jgi:REP-associated tyrosine transposase